MNLRICGVDPSLTSTGFASPGGVHVLDWDGATGTARLLKAHLWAKQMDVDVVIVEGYAMGARQGRAHSLGELGGVLRLAWHLRGLRVVEVPPTSLKKYATGKGNASKELVLVEAVKRLGYEGSSNDEADALWLRQIGLALFEKGPVAVPTSHMKALEAFQ